MSPFSGTSGTETMFHPLRTDPVRIPTRAFPKSMDAARVPLVMPMLYPAPPGGIVWVHPCCCTSATWYAPARRLSNEYLPALSVTAESVRAPDSLMVHPFNPGSALSLPPFPFWSLNFIPLIFPSWKFPKSLPGTAAPLVIVIAYDPGDGGVVWIHPD